MIKLVIFVALIVAFAFLIKAQIDRTSTMNDLLDLKCQEAYGKELRIIELAKELNLSYDENMKALRKICGNRRINKLTDLG